MLALVREDLAAPDVIAAVQASARAAVKGMETAPSGSAARKETLRGEIARLVDAVAQVGMSDALRERLQRAEAELASLATAAPRRQIDPDRIVRETMAAHKRRLLELSNALQQDDMDRERVRGLLAEILGPVMLRRDEQGDWAEMEEPAERVALAGSTVLGVARARNVRRKLIRPR